MSLKYKNQNQPVRLLVVDDEPMMRRLMQRTLEKHGAKISVADGAEAARRIIESEGCAAFDAVISDYLMPGESGLSLITWLRTKDASLSAIIITAETDERNLATQTLRAGGLDFLEKPIDTVVLLNAIDKAVDRTRKQRSWIATDSEVKLVAEIQNDLMGRQSRQYPGRFEVFFRPRHDAGGDFLRVIPEDEHVFEVLVGDVSGHDLRAAFISAYFQGIARGMRERGSTSQEVFQFFNSFLNHEWNNSEADTPRITSISACTIRVDLLNKKVVTLGCGAPTPLVLSTTGELLPLGSCGGHPLGWFEEYTAQEYHDSLDNAVCLYVWTDGVDELARQTQLNTTTILYFLIHGRRKTMQGSTQPDLSVDDILAARIRIQDPASQENGFWPFFFDTYYQDQCAMIDRFQASWTRSLREVFPEIDPENFHDILLATREAVLNALKHGCQRPDANYMTLQMNCNQDQKTVRVRISDNGHGHAFDWDFHDKQQELVDRHRGLTLIKRLPKSYQTERHGATIIMEFQLDTSNP